MFPHTVAQGVPVIVDFYSKFCLDCQKLAPKLDKLVEDMPGVQLVRVDIQQPGEQGKAMIKAFQVVTVPYVAFISKDAKVEKVFLQDVPAETLSTAAASLVKE